MFYTSEEVTLADLRLLREQLLFCIMNHRSTPFDLLEMCDKLHHVSEVIKLYE